MVDNEQRRNILDLTKRFTEALEASAVDEADSPQLYARFLRRLGQRYSDLQPGAAAITQSDIPSSNVDFKPAAFGIEKNISTPRPTWVSNLSPQNSPEDPSTMLDVDLDFSGADVRPGVIVHDISQIPVPLRVLVSPALSESMLLPGWMQPQTELHAHLSTDGGNHEVVQ